MRKQMSDSENQRLTDQNNRLAVENCVVEQVINSIFENVSSKPMESIVGRSDFDEINRFSHSMVENEFIVGSADENVLGMVHSRMSSNTKKPEISE